MKRSPTPPIYHTYLVTAWQERGRGAIQWRYTLEDTVTGNRHSFVHWDELVAMLSEQMTHLSGDQRDNCKSTE